jgi:hypothetical protein
MKLDRNINENGDGKYALLLLRRFDKLNEQDQCFARAAFRTLEALGILDWGGGGDEEFFVIRLRDKHASWALAAYAKSARHDDAEFADEVQALADKAYCHPNQKRPD